MIIVFLEDKMRKVVSKAVLLIAGIISLSLTLTIKIYASEDPLYYYDYRDHEQLQKITVEQIEKEGKLVPNDNVVVYPGDMYIKSAQNIPKDGKIYYIKFNSGKYSCLECYKYIRTQQSSIYGYVRDVYYYWFYEDGHLCGNRYNWFNRYDVDTYNKLVESDGFRIASLPESLPTSVDQGKIDKCKKMSVSELESVAKPVPKKLLSLEKGCNNDSDDEEFTYFEFTPHDDNIYYTEGKVLGNDYKEFYKFLYVSPDKENKQIDFNVLVWEVVNERLEKCMVFDRNDDFPELYHELTKKIYNVKRIYGSNRIDTAKMIAEEYNNSSVHNVILATGLDYPDALASSVLAKKLDAPILLTGANINDCKPTFDYISKHLDKDGQIYILGGETVVSQDIVEYLKKAGYSNIKRLSGTDRYDTCRVINKELNAAKGTPIFAVSADNFAYALATSSTAAIKGYPIVLVEPNNIPEQSRLTIEDMQPSEIYIVGNVDEKIADKLRDIANLPVAKKVDDSKVHYVGGEDKYHVSIDIAEKFDYYAENVVFATGENFPDALAGSVLAAKLNAPIILIGNDVSKQKQYIDLAKCKNIILFGGSGAISTNIEEQLKK